MAERRMFAKTIIDSDAFLDMPLSTQALYFHLSMRADDDGFVNNPKKIQRVLGASEDDLKVLIAKRFIIPFESGIVVIKHWKIHNYIQKDRYKETAYKEEKALLTEKLNHAYTIDTDCVHDVSKVDTQDRLGKDRIGKVSLGKDRERGAGETRTGKRKSVVDKNLENLNAVEVASWLKPDLEAIYPALVRWMTYKGEKGFPYKPTGAKTLVLMVCRNVHQEGAAVVETLIDESIANGYQGIIWDRLKDKRQKPQGVDIFDMIRKEEENGQSGSAEGPCDLTGGIPEFL